jgi:hypothetical protein
MSKKKRKVNVVCAHRQVWSELTIDWKLRTVHYRGSTVAGATDLLVIPIMHLETTLP